MAAMVLSGPVGAAPGGALGVLPIGDYACETPGDATREAGIAAPAENFTVVGAARYRSAGGSGLYLLTGDIAVMTSGPKAGTRYLRVSDNLLRRLDDAGRETELRCIRRFVSGHNPTNG